MSTVDHAVLDDLGQRVRHLAECVPSQSMPAEAIWGALFDVGLAWVDFPVGRGGLALDASYRDPLEAMLDDAKMPRNEAVNLVGVCTMAPTLVADGTAEQCDRHLRATFTCEQIWCQLFSEPGAGSDLATLATRADQDGDSWVINGQKVWTTLAHHADFGILLARTDPSVPKHAGLTFFLLDMHARGVEVRPLRQITGEAEYNEVFLTDVRIGDENRLGAVGGGWKVALDALANERRIGSFMARRVNDAGPLGNALELWRDAGAWTRTPDRRDRLAKLWIEAFLVRITSEREAAERRAGNESSGVSIGHAQRGSLTQRVADFCMEIRGPKAMLIDNYDLARPDHFTQISGEKASSDPTKAFLGARSLTIAGGTAEITKNVLAERVLGLPAEARVDRDMPWDASPRPASSS